LHYFSLNADDSGNKEVRTIATPRCLLSKYHAATFRQVAYLDEVLA